MRYEMAHNQKMLRGRHVEQRKTIARQMLRKQAVTTSGFFIWKDKLCEYDMLGFSSILVKISLNADASTALF